MSLLDPPRGSNGQGRGKIVRPLDMHITEAQRKEDETMTGSESMTTESQQKLLSVLATSGVATMKGFEIAQGAGVECDQAFMRDMDSLKKLGLIVGMRGKGWKLPGSVAPKRVGLDYTLASRLEQLIVKHNEEMLTAEKLAKLSDSGIAHVLEALSYLRREKLVMQAPGGWYKPVKVAQPTEEELREMSDEQLQDHLRGVNDSVNSQLRSLGDAIMTVKNFERSEGDDAHCTIDDAGKIVLTKGEARMELHAPDIERVFAFMQRTQPLWKKED